MHDTNEPLMPSDWPALSDRAAVEILEFLHELVVRFEAVYFVQIRRCYDQQRDLFDQMQPTRASSSIDDDFPF